MDNSLVFWELLPKIRNIQLSIQLCIQRITLMKNRIVLIAILGLAALACSDPSFAKSKHWTIFERQQALSQKVERGQKSMELTLKESNGFRDRLKSVNERIAKMKSKNAGKLSYSDEGKVEKTLNHISIDIDKTELNKRVQPK